VEALEERVKRLSGMRQAAERQRALMHRGLKLGSPAPSIGEDMIACH
jgi:hypothetical protein